MTACSTSTRWSLNATWNQRIVAASASGPPEQPGRTSWLRKSGARSRRRTLCVPAGIALACTRSATAVFFRAVSFVAVSVSAAGVPARPGVLRVGSTVTVMSLTPSRADYRALS